VLVDNNVVWGCDGHAFYQHDCSRLTVANNLFGECTKRPVFMRFNPKRQLDIETNRLATCEQNQVFGNVFYGFADRGPEMPADENASDYNVFVDSPGSKPFDLAAWQKRTGRESHSTTFTSTVQLSSAHWTLRQTPPIPGLSFPRIPAVTFDFFNTPRSGPTTEAGPFVERNWKAEIEFLPR
jgi:hypothetical protein